MITQFYQFQTAIYLQASDQFFTFEAEMVSVLIGNMTKTIPLAKGRRQTLLIPSNINDINWLLVS